MRAKKQHPVYVLYSYIVPLIVCSSSLEWIFLKIRSFFYTNVKRHNEILNEEVLLLKTNTVICKITLV